MSHSPLHKKVKIAFLICDQPHEKTLKKHGGFDECVERWSDSTALRDHGRSSSAVGSTRSLLHNTLEPLIKEEHEHLDLEIKGYDVGRCLDLADARCAGRSRR